VKKSSGGGGGEKATAGGWRDWEAVVMGRGIVVAPLVEQESEPAGVEGGGAASAGLGCSWA